MVRVALCAVLLVLAACSGSRNLQGEWVLVDVSKNGVQGNLAEAGGYLLIDDVELFGEFGCKSYGGSYTLVGETMSVGISQTNAECADWTDTWGIGNETSYKVEVSDDRLTLSGEDLRFVFTSVDCADVTSVGVCQ